MKRLFLLFLFIILTAEQPAYAKSCDGGGTSFRGGSAANNSVNSSYNTNGRAYRNYYSNQNNVTKPNNINGVQIIGN